MRVVINAQLDPQTSGGIAHVLQGLAFGLRQIDPGDEFVFVCSPASFEWLRPLAGGGVRMVLNDGPKLTPARGIRQSDGFWERFEPDVVHFPYQSFTRVRVPTLFNPHDLQHRHLPEYFTAEERERRDLLFRQAFEACAGIAVASQWVRHDVVQQYGVAASKIHVLPWGAPTELQPSPSKEDVRSALSRHQLEPGFALYPAQTWPHKNHIRLLEAISLLRANHHRAVRLVCTGHLTDHFAEIDRRLHELGLSDQVRFLGRVSDAELAALYAAARLLILPTLFEAASFPVLEASRAGVPVACSNVTSLPDITAGAARLFDPQDPCAIAQAILELDSDEALRDRLIRAGHEIARRHSWQRAASAYRNVYQAVAISSPSCAAGAG